MTDISSGQIYELIVYNIMSLIVLLTILGLSFTLDVQLQMEYENTLRYVIDVVNNSQLHQFDYEHYNKCVSLMCCVCGQQFKSHSASALHSNVHHNNLLKFDSDLAILFN